MTDDDRRCTATSRSTGERCRQPAVAGRSTCHYHGGRGGAPKGNLNGLIHGAYVARVLDQEEQRIRDRLIAQLRRDFILNDSSDEMAVQMAAMAFIQYLRAQRAGKEAPAAAQARIVRNSLRDLKATRSARERSLLPLNTTPAEWASALIAKMKELRGMREATGPKTNTDRRKDPHDRQE